MISIVTYYDPENSVYDVLGYGINVSGTEDLIPLTKVEIYDASVVGVVKVLAGSPG